jgi:hypothetical protein
MGQLVSESAVIGKQEQTVGVHIKSTDGVETDGFAVIVLNVAAKVGDVAPALFVACGADDSARLIEHYADLVVCRRLYCLAAIDYLVGIGVDLLAKLGNVTVDVYSAQLYFFLSRAAGHYAAIGEIF